MAGTRRKRASVAGVSKGKSRPVTRRQPKGSNAENSEQGHVGTNSEDSKGIVFSEPVLVPPATFDPALGTDTYCAVDYENVRYSVGDHVALFAGPGKEWVCVIEQLYASAEDGRPCFKGRWYWSVADVEDHRSGRGEKCRTSKNAKHELIVSDNRDSNLVEVINRKCAILSWKNFRDLYKRDRSACEGIYFCDRMYYHKAFKFQELTHITYPGDPIPSHIRPGNAEAECDELGEQRADDPELRAFADDVLHVSEAIREPPINRPSTAVSSPSTENPEPNVPQDASKVQPQMKAAEYYLF